MTQEFQDLKVKVETNIAAQQQLISVVNTLVARLGSADLPQDIAALASQVQAATDTLSAVLNSVPPAS